MDRLDVLMVDLHEVHPMEVDLMAILTLEEAFHRMDGEAILDPAAEEQDGINLVQA